VSGSPVRNARAAKQKAAPQAPLSKAESGSIYAASAGFD
jgi:hypothetical protein